MSDLYLADNVDSNGKVYPTVGEHIRHSSSSINASDVCNCVKNNTDRAKICDTLDVTAENLKVAIVNLLSGKTAYFGGLDINALSSDELVDIKAYLGIV